ncbi:MAG: hypothetical protein VKI82_09470 [Leptolyngbya sp.]|nr:hypothetical protein [Leptolyngbya sp.]
MARRLWIYQKERFPLIKHGFLIAVFSGAAVGYGASLTATVPHPASALVAFFSTLSFFWQMRVADEFKDLADDAQYRPYRPIPRGLVSLKALAILGGLSALLQAILALWLAPVLAVCLLGIWAYFGLMGQEFFVRPWLKAHPVAYGLSHMVIVPLMGAYAVATQTYPWAGSLVPVGLVPFLGVCFCNGLVIELGRKIRLPAGEEPGVETYSALWGLPVAVRVWLGAVGLTAAFALGAAWQIYGLGVMVPLLAALLGWIAFKTWPWLEPCSGVQPSHLPPDAPPGGQESAAKNRKTQDILDLPTAVWTLGIYLGLGWVPWFLGGG